MIFFTINSISSIELELSNIIVKALAECVNITIIIINNIIIIK